ncbi:MAG: dihydrofolate reductase [Gemmatimonadales bacterium]
MILMIAAVAENGVIGSGMELPWHLPADLKHFKDLTTGHTIIMGRKTFDSCDRKPLPNRRNIVVTRATDFVADGVEVAHSVEDALELSRGDERVYVVGGAQIYQSAFEYAEVLEVTHIHSAIEGDIQFPKFDLNEWEVVSAERHEADERHAHAFTFVRYERKKAVG